jgi:two-component system, NarL family, nitrate/nitrite response regulator NarL
MRVLVISANNLAQVGLGALVEQADGLEVAAAVALTAASDAVARLTMDAILLDSGPEGSDALALLEQLGREVPRIPVAVITDSPSVVAEALSAGASAVLSVDISPATLAGALGAAAAGLVVLGRDLVSSLLPAGVDGDEELRPIERLTPRESEVLQLLARGMTNAEVGSRLGVSEHTAKFHVGAVLGKLGARSRAEAVAVASRLGWITV